MQQTTTHSLGRPFNLTLTFLVTMIDFTHLLVGALLAKASFAFPTPFANFARAAGDTCPASVVSCQNDSGVNSCCVETPGVSSVCGSSKPFKL